MQFTKEFTQQIALNVDDMFSGLMDAENTLLYRKIRDMFVNKCHDGCKIKEILSITHQSAVIIDKSDLNAGGFVYVKFLASVMQYSTDDVIVGATVIELDKNNNIICKDDDTVITVRNFKTTGIEVGAKVIVQVDRACITVGSSEMAVYGRILMPFKSCAVFNITSPMTEQEIKHVESLMDFKTQKFSKEALLFPYTGLVNSKLPTLTIRDLIKNNKPAVVCAHTNLAPMSTAVYDLTGTTELPAELFKEFAQSMVVIETTLYKALIRLVAETRAAYKLLTTCESVPEDDPIWKVYEAKQK